jgi:phosphohistidine phosphatase
MKLFLVRHTHAVADKDDPRRRLSPQGRETAQKLAEFFRGKPALDSVHAVWHSPLLRARETAELLVQGLGLDVLLVETTGLQPEDDPAVVAQRVERLDQAVMIVGHEPQLSALATLLVRDKVKPVGFKFKKGAVMALESTGGSHKKSGRTRWCVCWHFSPELLTGEAAGAADE